MKRSTMSHVRRQTELITAVSQSFAGFKDLDRDPSTAAAPNETGLLAAAEFNDAI